MNPSIKKVQLERKKNSGQSAIEFALVMPILLVFILAVLECSAMFVEAQRASALSREIANAVFRDCGNLNDSAGNPQLTNCVDSIVNPVGGAAAKLLPDFNARGKIIASLYKGKVGNQGSLQFKPAGLAAQKTSGLANFNSRYDISNIDLAILNNQKLLSFGEVFYQYKPLTQIGSFLQMILPRNYYEVTIY